MEPTSVSAYYLIRGWNAEHPDHERLPMPAYLSGPLSQDQVLARQVRTLAQPRSDQRPVSLPCKVPTTLHHRLKVEAAQRGCPMRWLGALYICLGWNEEHPDKYAEIPTFLTELRTKGESLAIAM